MRIQQADSLRVWSCPPSPRGGQPVVHKPQKRKEKSNHIEQLTIGRRGMVLEPEPNHRGIRSEPPPKQTVKNIEEKEYGGNIMASLMEQVSCLT